MSEPRFLALIEISAGILALKVDYSNYDLLIVDIGSSSADGKKLKEKFGKINVVELKRNLGFANTNNV